MNTFECIKYKQTLIDHFHFHLIIITRRCAAILHVFTYYLHDRRNYECIYINEPGNTKTFYIGFK